MCLYTEKKLIFSYLILILSIQSTLRLKGESTGLKDILNEHNLFFLNWRVKVLFSQNCFDFHFQCISRIKKKNVTLFY